MNTSRRRIIQLALGIAIAATGSALTAVGAGAAHAQEAAADYPSRTIRMVVPYPPGGGADLIGRTIAAGLHQAWNVPVIVENKPGASGTIGNDAVAKADPDGYTILLGITAMIQAPALYPRLPYEVKDLAPVSQIAMSSDLFVVPSRASAKTLSEFIELVKANPGQFQVGNYGNGTSSHIHGELLKLKTGIDLVSVAYRGAAPLVNDMLGQQLTSAFIDATSANAHLGSDKIRILAITGLKRHPALPDVPTFAESGIDGYEANGWFGTFVPAGTPKPIIDKLSGEIQRIVKSPEMTECLESMGLRPVGSTPEELAAVIEADTPRWGSVVRDAGIKLQ
ncbi:MAG TPA: tripartite tricarboxylate transporter substrate binding protein [Burkholderiaceae bacterium]|nr:tripartite tricarboxylate transporter substrate binding protein [Burkholderiaceae bacterium]